MASSLQRSPSRWLRGCPLGFGSFGHVSLALDLDDGTLFAVKSAPVSSANPSPSPHLSLQREFHVLRSLDSPRVVRCLGASFSPPDVSPCFNLFMEYMAEGTVADLVKRSGGRLDETITRSCTRAILEGLSYLHTQGIVHCDIKGQNILLGSSGEIKIADFGSARRVAPAENPEGCTPRGTPLWMAPEVIQGVDQGTASDIWSLGCTLVEMLQGRSPWAGNHDRMSSNDLTSLLLRIAYSSESPPLEENMFSEAAIDFLSRCLDRDPKKRWTAARLLDHPFVTENGIGGSIRLKDYCGQPSPRGVLDFYGYSDLETESSCSVDAYDGSSRLYRATPKSEQTTVEGGCSERWLTVRHMKGWSEERLKPFFRKEQEVIVQVEGRVRFESVGFLARRGMPVVG